MKFCINCKFYQASTQGAEYAKCICHGNIVTSMVDGSQTLTYPYCEIQRKYEYSSTPSGTQPSCGPEAKFFEAKEQAA